MEPEAAPKAAADPEGQKVLIRGNVRMTRGKAPLISPEATPPQPSQARDIPALALSPDRIFAGGDGSRWLLDELIVGYRKGTTRRQKDQLRLDRGLYRIAAAREKLSKLEVERVGLTSRLDSSGVAALISELRGEPIVEYVEPNFVVETDGFAPGTTADLANAILDIVDHGANEIVFPVTGRKPARVVRDALAYARRNAVRIPGDRRNPLGEAPHGSGGKTTPDPSVLADSAAQALPAPPPVPVYTSSRCGELAAFLPEDAAVQARISLGWFPLDDLKMIEQSGSLLTHLVYRWNDHTTLYPVRAGEDLGSAMENLKAQRERFVARQVESLAELVAEFRPLDEEQERFRQALTAHRDAYLLESEDLAAGLFHVDAADIIAPGGALRSFGRTGSVKLESCTVGADAFRGTLSDGEAAARVRALLDSEQLQNVVAASENAPQAPSTWSPSMGVHRVDLRDSVSPMTLHSYFWWNDTSGFAQPHRAYEHEIRIVPWNFVECQKTWWSKIPSSSRVSMAQWRSVFFDKVNDRVWEGRECSRLSVHSSSKLPEYYVDIRLYDLKSQGKIFTVGTLQSSLIKKYELYEVSFDLVLDDAIDETAALIFQPQLGHWHSDYSGDDTPPREKSFFCSLSGQFCTEESCRDEENSEQACVFSSDFLKVIDPRGQPQPWNIKKGELTTIVWSANIGLYGGFAESRGEWLACRSDATEPCRDVVSDINDKSTDLIREVYYSFVRSRAGGNYQCNKLGVPYSDNGGGVYVHSWDGVRLQNFKHPSDTGCERFGNDGETAIVYNPRLERAFLLRDGMWEKYRSGNGPLRLGPPASDEYPLAGVGAQQTFERGCLTFFSSTGRVEERSGAACASDPTAIDFRFAELGGLRVKPGSNRVELILRLREAGLAAAAAHDSLGETVIDLEQARLAVTKTFLQALAIPDHKHRISLDIVGSGGHAEVPAPFERTDMADAFLDADVAMKFDMFGESGLTRETEIWTNLVRQSPYWSELDNKGFEQYPSWIIAATIIPGEITATQTDNRIVVEDVELDLRAGWWRQEPVLDLSGYSLSSGARSDLLQRLATYKTTLENIVKDYARNVVVPEMNRTENLDPRYKRLKSIYSSIALAQWYKARIRQNPKLPYAVLADSENLAGIDKGTPFNQAYWDGQANQILWSGPCTAFWGTAECEIFGGLELADSAPRIVGGLTPVQEQMVAVVLDDFATVEEGDTQYVYGAQLTAPSAELSLGEVAFQPGPYLAGRPVTLQTRVLNTGIAASGSFLVTVYDDVPGSQGQPIRHLVGQATLSLAPLQATAASFPWTFPPAPGHHTFTVVVDSTQAVNESDESDNSGIRSLDVGSTAPVAQIQYPANGSAFASSEDIAFLVGEGTDPEEGDLPADRLAWSSSVDGFLGSGPELDGLTLSPGEHAITLTVSDGEGLSATDEVHIQIAANALDFFTVTPCRVLDTRSGAPLVSSSARAFPLAGLCGLPPSARAVSVNVTVVAPTGAGYVTLWRADLVKPGTSAINFPVGRTLANNLILTVATDGSGAAMAEAFVAGSGTVHLTIDVNGYFQ